LKLLLDTCVWGDQKILACAHAENRVLVTLDKDFGELVVVRGQPHSGIIRLVDISATRQGDVCAWLLNKYAAELERSAILTVDDARVRIREQISSS
jgi:predicted nuclease of predicted toxin-antitoxin system